MQIQINGKNVEVPTTLASSIQTRLQKLADRYRFLQQGFVSLGKERNWSVCEITLHVKHQLLRAKERANDLGSAVDITLEKLEKQLATHKGRLEERSRQSGKEIPALIDEPVTDADEEYRPPRVVKVKKIAIKPMSVEEATLQMELLGHSFFVFTNSEDEEMNVIYRRDNGDVGLIQPE